MTPVYALPEHADINFTLENVDQDIQCPAFLKGSKMKLHYDYEFDKSWGWAHLLQLGSTSIDEPLYPLGMSSVYGFMSNMAPKTITVDGNEVVLYRIIFNLQKNGDAKVSIMIGSEGDCFMSTDTVQVTDLTR